MKKEKFIISYVLLFVSLMVFIIASFSNTYNFSYIFALLFFITLSIYNFIIGIKVNKEKNYRMNINIYIIMYFILFICLTMFIGRSGFGLINSEYFKYYISSINIIPFKTIVDYMFNDSNTSVKLYNLIGNFVALMPLSFLLVLKNEKYKQTNNQYLALSIIVISVECLQLLLSAGRFDIDDYILNVGGALIFFTIISKIKLIDKIKNIFYSDLKLKTIIKNFLYYLFMIIIIIIDVAIICGLIEANSYQKDTDHQKQDFYVETLEENNIRKIELDDYNIYLIKVEVIYEENDLQSKIEEAFKNGNLNRTLIADKLKLIDTLKDGGTTIYKNQKENITAILCNTIDGNKDIYLGNYEMNYQNSYCK